MNQHPVNIEVTIAAPVDTVWHALRDRDVLRQWHGWEYEEGSGLAGEIESIYLGAEAHADDAAHRLEVEGGDVFTVEPDPATGGVRVTVTRAMPADDPDWAAYYDDVTEGWITFVHQLKFVLEQRPAGDRRTLFLSGRPAAGAPVGALGLTEVATLPVGAPYEADLPGGPVNGTVWFRSAHQLGLTVDDWGPGLLVVCHVEPTADRPDGIIQAVLSTYGIGDDAHKALDQRWTAWWQPAAG